VIHWSVEGGVAVVTLDRPERHNALDIDTVIALTARLHVAGATDPPVVVTGTGRTFCAGFDLTTRDRGTEFKEHADELFDAVQAYPAPVIAALNGPAIGMGCVLAAMCDIRIGSEASWLEIPAARLGVVLDAAYVSRVRDRLGWAAAQLLFVASRRIEGIRAAEIGAVHARVEDPLSEAMAWAVHIASLDGASIAMHKSQPDRVSTQSGSEVLDHILVSKALKKFTYQVVHLNAEFANQVSDYDPQVVDITP
jgi:enoyl-CoA hydratase